MKEGKSPTTFIFSDSSRRCLAEDSGIAPLILLAIVGIVGLLGVGFVAAFDWTPILAMFALGIVGIAFIGVIFFKANFNLVLIAAIVGIAIVFVMEVSLIVIVGAAITLFAMWNFKLLRGKPLMFALLVVSGLAVMLLGTQFILIPMGLMP